jgi:hypothetical protein
MFTHGCFHIYIRTTLFISGMITRCFTHPLDTCKAKMQVAHNVSISDVSSTKSTTLNQASINNTHQQQSVSNMRASSTRSLWQTLRQTYMHEGTRGLYSGFGITFFGSAPANCIYLTSYEFGKKRLSDISLFSDKPFLVGLCAGMMSEILSCVLWVPIDIVKERLQVQHEIPAHIQTTRYSGNVDAFKTILKVRFVLFCVHSINLLSIVFMFVFIGRRSSNKTDVRIVPSFHLSACFAFEIKSCYGHSFFTMTHLIRF